MAEVHGYAGGDGNLCSGAMRLTALMPVPVFCVFIAGRLSNFALRCEMGKIG